MLKKFSVHISENTDFFKKIQTKYRPILEIFLKKSVLQTKIIFTDQCVIAGGSTSPVVSETTGRGTMKC